MTESVSVHNLLVQLKYGQDEVIDILYPRYARGFYTHAKHRGLAPEDAEDIVQDTFDRILHNIKNYDEYHGGGERWMWRICNNLITDALRKHRPMAELSEEDFPSDDTNPESYFERTELIKALSRAWEKISEADREELRRGRGRGYGRNTWHEAAQRFRTIFYEE